MIEKFCLQCGKEIPPPTAQVRIVKYCCAKCANKAYYKRKAESRRSVYAAEPENTKPSTKKASSNVTNLERCMKEADRQGLTYGQYMARKGG